MKAAAVKNERFIKENSEESKNQGVLKNRKQTEKRSKYLRVKTGNYKLTGP